MGLVLYHTSDISVDFGKRDKLLSQRANAKFLAGKRQPAILSTLDNLFVHACNRQFHLLGYRPLVDDPAPDSATKITQIPGVLLHQRGSLGLDPIRLDPQLRGQRRLACFTWVRRHRILWWWATWSGYRAVRNQQLVPHICWMVRSYALALSAVAFRVIQQLVVYAPISDDANYIVSLWLSLLASFWFSESCIRRQFVSDEKRRKIPKWFSLFSQSNTTLAKSKLTLKKQTA